ncbi:putative short-chain oxidoreductase [Hypoxylon rubiginosum]|uniref:Short-chain oxidoreductase n=1 Tax=Hypoxylon rubiginosum TaxID=110542 RepID=A0ACC0D5X6_9PEZI|nr:putative short-chain oxidoreductase [Hypoxylon rubiginosum]
MSATFTKPKSKLTWLITGCSSGFGLTLTRIALAAGHTVIATSRNPSRTPELVAEVEENGGKWLKLDVDDRASASVVEELAKSGVEIDVLVNNAGYAILSPAETATEEELRKQMESMYFGPLRLIRAVLPHMRKQKYGVIVNISTGAAIIGRDTMGGYGGAKAALDSITRALSQEIAPYNIRTLTVILGAFNTNMPKASVGGEKPLPQGYEGSPSELMLQFLSGTAKVSGLAFKMGDKEKAMKAVYEMVVGEGIGAGREAEQLLPLGFDMIARFKEVQESYGHALDVFEDIAGNVNLDQ